MVHRPTAGVICTPAVIPFDAAGESPPHNPILRFARLRPPAPAYRVYAAQYDSPADAEPRSAVVLDTTAGLKTALAIAAGWAVSGDLGADVTDVLVTSPDGEQLHRYAAGGL